MGQLLCHIDPRLKTCSCACIFVRLLGRLFAMQTSGGTDLTYRSHKSCNWAIMHLLGIPGRADARRPNVCACEWTAYLHSASLVSKFESILDFWVGDAVSSPNRLISVNSSS